MANMDEVDPAIEIFMKEFVYVFIIDLGISPFVKCYQNKSIVQACVLSRRLDFLRELLCHKYEVMNPKQVAIMAKTCQGKDILRELIIALFDNRSVRTKAPYAAPGTDGTAALEKSMECQWIGHSVLSAIPSDHAELPKRGLCRSGCKATLE